MRKRRVSTVMAAWLLLAVLAAAPGAGAQGTQVKPYLLFIFDTSGSMVRNTSGAATYGDGSWDPWGSRWCCPGRDLDGDTIWNDSRMWISKEAIRKMVAATGDITFGLMKFPQRFSAASNLGGVLYLYNQTPSGEDQICYSGWTSTGGNYCTSSNIGEFLVVPFAPESSDDVYQWVNHTEYVGGVHVEHELRGNGTTPLAWTIGRAGDYFEGTGLFGSTRVIPVDPYRGCRPYYAVVLADGDNTLACGSNPVTEVQNMWALRPGVDPACSVDADCPGDYPTSPWGARCVAGQCQYHVYTYVIGMAYSSASLNNMADVGDDGILNGSAAAFRADSEAELSAILSTIVRDSVLVEICNDLDDNCNGLVDEGFTKFCDLQDVFGGGSTSSLVYCLDPGETVCDGFDDNCDGSIDEGLLNACGACGPVPPEVCDGLDNDCDGSVDEGGVCGGCVISPETCNNADDDCDTIIDNGLSRRCGTDVGECTSGMQTCTAGVWGACVGEVGPGTETCNGLDDDCNGVVDGMTATCSLGPTPCDLGECACGYRICISGSWTSCMGGVGPVAERCDGLDNDCDGTDDEGDPGGGAACGTDMGECSGGTVHCVAGALACTGGTGPVAETCNCLDDDCDGSTDEGNPGGGAPCGPVTLDGVGICEAGVQTCTACSVVCIGAVWPGTEDCNGLDDDCNTLVDDGIPTGDVCGSDVGECSTGRRNCIAGAWVCVGEVGPTPEVCDGLDNDCDGSTDEGNPGGGLPCGTDVGICEPGVTMCDTTLTPPAIICYGEIGPETEVCNGLDDDCNGLVDDGIPLGDACGTDEGECEEGVYICNKRGELECAFGRGPSPEICDCLDNDCDALVDEENPCPSGVCVDCSCAGPCNPTEEWPCPSGRVCMEVDGMDGYWCVGDPCEDVVCEEECDRCLYGECVDPCVGVVCPDGQVCSVDESCTARCVPADCYAPGHECGPGERCRDGECEADPCWGVDCGDDRFCREGECFDACGPEDACEDGFVCRDGECIADPCFGVTCTGGRICVDGTCVDDPCEDVFCPPPRICIDGTCTDDPCSYIVCPEGYVCVGDTCVDETTLVTDEVPESVPDAAADGSTAGQDILATGAGGCAGCTLAARDPAAGPGLLAALLALAAGLIARRRRGD